MEEVEYTRLLDSLARFYNSEITAHVGYELTVTVGFFAALLGLTSIVLGLCNSIWPAMLIFDCACLVVFFLAPLWPCFKYLYGRLQYYGELSQATFEHMGLKTPYMSQPDGRTWRTQEYVLRLMEKALQNENGIEGGIDTLFAARLYVSKCNRAKRTRDRTDPSTIKQDLERVFGLGDIVTPNEHRYVTPDIPGEWLARKLGWMRVDLLLLAYRQRKNTIRKERADLLFGDR